MKKKVKGKVKIEIKSIWGKILFKYSCIDNSVKRTLEKAVDNGTDLQEADLQEANLRKANLRGANLQEANLRKANLREANLWEANLQRADLWGAKNIPNIFKSDLSILKFQKGKLRAFKYLDGNTSPYQENIEYKVGKIYTEKQCDTDEFVLCGAGLNVATLDWCLKDTGCNLDKTYIEVEFDAKDIVAIPYNSDGKFRVKKLKVIRKLTKLELKKYIKPLKEKK